MLDPLPGKASHRRIGYDPCECGRRGCRARRRADRKRERRIQAHELRTTLYVAGGRDVESWIG